MTTVVTQEGEYKVTREDGIVISKELNRPTPPVPSVDTSKLIDLGPFFDRFGVAMMPVLMSVDPTVVAIRANINSRKWVDLTLPIVSQSLTAISAIIPALTPAIQNSILTSPVQLSEQYALLKVYFS
jgi:hypothetical protein